MKKNPKITRVHDPGVQYPVHVHMYESNKTRSIYLFLLYSEFDIQFKSCVLSNSFLAITVTTVRRVPLQYQVHTFMYVPPGVHACTYSVTSHCYFLCKL
jgi:hypothetical protein